jgi:hypothetical protein
MLNMVFGARAVAGMAGPTDVIGNGVGGGSAPVGPVGPVADTEPGVPVGPVDPVAPVCDVPVGPVGPPTIAEPNGVHRGPDVVT